MIKIRPFKAIRPNPTLVKKVASLPYDVMNSEEAKEMVVDNQYSFLHIDKAEVDLPNDIDHYDHLVYETAAANLKKFIQKEWLIQDSKPAYYIYCLSMNNRKQTGLVACTSVEDYLKNKIKKHEFTRTEKEIDRINHIDYCDANTSPIFLTYRKQDAISNIINDWMSNHQPIYDFNSFHNVDHQVYLIDDLTIINTISSLFESNVPALYIADGHHRTESAVKVALKRKALNKDFNEEHNYFLSVLFPKEDLAILDYNRVVKYDIPNNFIELISEEFIVTKVNKSIYKPTKATEIAMYLDKQWYSLQVKENYLNKEDKVLSLDVSLLQKYILEKQFNIMDIKTDQRIDFVGGIRGIEELVKLVDTKTFDIAFAMYPTSMDDLLVVADNNQIMPPKSTWFEPKLLSGLFLHDLETK